MQNKTTGVIQINGLCTTQTGKGNAEKCTLYLFSGKAPKYFSFFLNNITCNASQNVQNIKFDNLQAAKHYCKVNNIEYDIFGAKIPLVTSKKNYTENYIANRRYPWTH